MVRTWLAALAVLGVGCSSAEPMSEADRAELALPHNRAPATDRAARVPRLAHSPRARSQLLVTLQVTPAGVRLLQAVESPRDAVPLSRPERESWTVEVLSASGSVVHSASAGLPNLVYLEVPDSDRYERLEARRDEAVIAVRLPIIDGAAQLRVTAPASTLPAKDPRQASIRADRRHEPIVLGVVPFPRSTP